MENILKIAKNGFNKFITFTGADGFNIIFSFLLGRVVLFDCLSPFALAYLGAYCANNPDNLVKATLIALSALLGAFSAGASIGLIKYILAFILFGLIYNAVTTISEKHLSLTSAITTSVSILISGIIFIGQWGVTFYYIAMLIMESIMCFSISMFMAKALNYKELDRDGVIAICALAALTVVGFGDVTFGAVSPGKIMAGIYIMAIAFCAGLGGGAAGGIAVGVLYSFTTYPYTDSIGIFSICGLVCGAMAKYKRTGIICGYLMANILLYVYLGGSSGSVLSVFDIITSAIIFCLIPKTTLIITENIIKGAVPKDKDIKKTVNEIYEKLTSISKKVKDIAADFNIKPTHNKQDIMTIFDKSADKICKRCGLKFVCWEKEFNLTYDQLLHHAPVLQKEGKIEKSKVLAEFKNRCIHWEQYINEVNKIFAQFTLDNIWIKKVEAGRKLVSSHLNGLADVMESFAEETKKNIDFIPNPDNVLYLAIKKHGIKCYNTSVIKTELGQHEVWIKAQSCDENALADITSEVLGRRFYIKETKKDGKKITVHLLEREKFSVITGAAARTKDGSKKSGDSYCQKRLEHNRHIAILSDGMGSGENARNQSLYAVDVMLRLLNCGFNKDCAIKIMNLSLFLRQTKESFATIDAAVIDLFEGSAEFIKIGAASSYIKRGNKVKKITSDSLPAGMITEITPYTTKTNIQKDDVIVLASDGIGCLDETWLTDFLTKATEDNPQKLAENVIKEAVIRGDHTAKDDMTVIALKITEEIA